MLCTLQRITHSRFVFHRRDVSPTEAVSSRETLCNQLPRGFFPITTNLICKNLGLTVTFPTYHHDICLLHCSPYLEWLMGLLQGDHHCKKYLPQNRISSFLSLGISIVFFLSFAISFVLFPPHPRVYIPPVNTYIVSFPLARFPLYSFYLLSFILSFSNICQF